MIPLLLLVGCASEKETQSQVSTITHGIADYQKSGKVVPSLENKDIYQLLVNDSEDVRYNPYERSLKENQFIDGWGTPLKFFRNDQDQIVAWSAGRDGIFDPKRLGEDILGMTQTVRKESIQAQ